MQEIGRDIFIAENFLSLDLFAKANRIFRTEEFSYRNKAVVEPVLRLFAGSPLEGQTYRYSYGQLSEPSSGKVGRRAKTVMREIAGRVAAACDDFKGLIGSAGEGWTMVSIRPTMFSAGVSHAWHTDGQRKAGAFIIYAHPEWKVDWGGELIVRQGEIDDALYPKISIGDKPAAFYGNHFGNERESSFLMEGISRVVFPRPNRLVVIRNPQYYTIRRVSRAAGNHVRCAFSGFFYESELQ